MIEPSNTEANDQIYWCLNDVAETARAYLKSECTEQGCRIRLDEKIQRRFIIDVEEYWIRERIIGKVSDCLILCSFSGKKQIAIVELKKGSDRIMKTPEKIQNVCNHISEIIEEHSLVDFVFYPILLSKSISPMAIKFLRAKMITLQEHSEYVIRENCNVTLSYIFKKY